MIANTISPTTNHVLEIVIWKAFLIKGWAEGQILPKGWNLKLGFSVPLYLPLRRIHLKKKDNLIMLLLLYKSRRIHMGILTLYCLLNKIKYSPDITTITNYLTTRGHIDHFVEQKIR